ncbi:NAD-dependent epimerase/dehydratase family protein [Nemorincola caseinilytica]|uniref:NAD-dependent epimerase/dehydratase family protein n=2 Tax=Nemorincola caseinilytica TaxID=2054315 RepID=A0ABP8NEX0_9BACT
MPGKDMQLPGVEWMRCDLLDVYDVEDALQGIEDIYHCAAIVTFDPRLAERMLHFNPESTANIVNQAVEQGIRKMVYVSSIAALGRTGSVNQNTNEEQEWGESRYNSAYGLSKYLAECEVWRGIGEGLNAVIVNPSVILGPGDFTTGSPQIINLAHKEFPFYTTGINGWVDVADVVKAMVMLMASDIEAERFIVSQGDHSYRHIFTLMAQALGKRPPRMHAGPFITGIAWRLGAIYSRLSGRPAVITRETARTAHGHSTYNNGKLLAALPQFSYTPIEDSIAHMAHAFMHRA